MSKDQAGLAALLEASAAGVPHLLRQYLYFPSKRAAAEVAAKLRHRGFFTEERLGADQVNWVVLARHRVIPSEEVMATTRQLMEELAAAAGGEYDGWEADVQQ